MYFSGDEIKRLIDLHAFFQRLQCFVALRNSLGRQSRRRKNRSQYQDHSWNRRGIDGHCFHGVDGALVRRAASDLQEMQFQGKRARAQVVAASLSNRAVETQARQRERMRANPAHIRSSTSLCLCVFCMYVCMYVCMYGCVYGCLYEGMSGCMCGGMAVCLHVCVYACM